MLRTYETKFSELAFRNRSRAIAGEQPFGLRDEGQLGHLLVREAQAVRNHQIDPGGPQSGVNLGQV